jgi:glycosyltransferase involved in cell wall biosynthesis
MKILHIETGRHLYGGGQQVLWLLAGLLERRVDVVLVCAEHSALAAAASANGIRVIGMPCHGDLDLLFARRLGKVLRAERPDLVHCHSRRGADTLGGRAAARAGIPALVSRRVDNREAAWLARLRYRPFARIVAISRAIAGVLADCGVDGNRVSVIRSAVDAAPFQAAPDGARFRREFGLRETDRVLVSAAQFIPRKGQRYVIQAMARLLPRYPDLRLILFGRGPLEQDLRAQTGKLGLDGQVRFAGFRDDLDRYLGCAELLVHPALREGLGVVALKAAAAGVPVVGFAAGGLPEAVLDGRTGLLVPPGDVMALTGAIAALLDDDTRRRQFAEAARTRVQTEFSIEAMVDAHLKLYRSQLALADG